MDAFGSRLLRRRDFLRQFLLSSGALYATGALPGVMGDAKAGFAAVDRTILADITLLGGPDFRHLFPPAFNADTTTFGYQYWKARARAHDLAYSSSAYAARYGNDYSHNTAAGVEFGILKSCGWLQGMYTAGKVALVTNCYGGASRDHAHCTLVLDQGNLSSGPNDGGRPGWGGRLANALRSNVASLTSAPRPFCFGADPDDALRAVDNVVVSAGDTRNLALYHPAASDDSRYIEQARMARALKSYYAAKAVEMNRSARGHRVVELEEKIRDFGEAMDDRLSSVPVPGELAALYADNGTLFDPTFGLQVRNLYDALACNDILDMRVASLEYQGFDTHKDQKTQLESRLADLFGTGKALDRLWQALPAAARQRLVLVIAGEFGRQLVDNGDQGTDHGVGNTVLVIGDHVKGGVYGTLFPKSDLDKIRNNVLSPDTDGLTALDHPFGRICDYLAAGAGSLVFPDRATRPIEARLDLSKLFA